MRTVLLLCCAAQFMVILDISIVNVALPSIEEDLGFSATGLQWVVNGYTLAFAGFLLLAGRANDLLGARRVFVSGLLLFVAASAAGGVAQGPGWLVAARAAQGLGGALVAPATLSILTTSFAEGAERNRALGLWGAMGGAGGAMGALLGGVLVQWLSWRWILLINIPIGLAILAGALQAVSAARPERVPGREFDVAGALTVTAGLVVLTYGIVATEQHGWGSARSLATMGAGVVLLVGFLVIEGSMARRPLVPLRIFRSRALTGGNVVVFCRDGAVFAMWYFVSLYVQRVLGFDPLQAGLTFLPMTAMMVLFSWFAGRATSRVGAGPVLTGGMLSIAVGMLLFSGIEAGGSYVGDVLLPSVIVAAGVGCSFVPATIAATAGVAREEAGLAAGLVNTSRQVGGALGLALLATVATQRTADLGTGSEALTAGYVRAFELGAAIAFAGAVLCVLLLVRGVPAATREHATAEPAPVPGVTA